MALYLMKPLLWNTKQYVKPAGVKASRESYPGTYGFGHEEWNNSPLMGFKDDGQHYRAFYTERVGRAPVYEHAGQTFVFMIASHGGLQQLVGVAGNAMYLVGDEHRSERRRIAKLLNVKELWRDAWELSSVKEKFDNNIRAFRDHWKKDAWEPKWICPANFFMWLQEPVTIDPKRITDSNALPMRFSSYMTLNRDSAEKIMHMVPAERHSDTWHRLVDAMQVAFNVPVLQMPEDSTDGKATSRLTNINARIGQGQFRDALMGKWGHRCAVTELSCSELLRASHVKPWVSSTDYERTDPNNGLLLAAHLDALFDKGLISFNDGGEMMLSSRLKAGDLRHLRLPAPLRRSPDSALRKYLCHHREQLFKP